MKSFLIALGLLFTTLTLAGPAWSATVFARPSTLDATLRSAPCGATVVLRGPPPFGPTRALSGRSCPATKPVTIDATGAEIAGLWYFSRVAGVAIKGGLWRGGRDAAGKATIALRFDDAEHIRISGAKFDGPNTVPALMLMRTRQVAVTESDFTGFIAGISVIDADGLTVEHNRLHGLRADGMVAGRANNVRIADNVCEAANERFGADHPDCFQFYGAPGRVSTGIQVLRNRLSGFAQGVFLADGAYADVVIGGNTIAMAMGRGISVGPCTGCRVSGNTVSTARDAPDQSEIFLMAGIARCGNKVAPYMTPRGGRKRAASDGKCAAADNAPGRGGATSAKPEADEAAEPEPPAAAAR